MDAESDNKLRPKIFSQYGIETDEDALRVMPSGFTDLSTITVGFASLCPGETVVLSARMYSRPRIDTKRRDALAIFNITDTTNSLPVFCWGDNAWQAYNSDIDIGELIHITGMVRENQESGLLTLTDARLISPNRAGAVEPIYTGDGYRSSTYIERIVKDPAIRQAAANKILSFFPGETSRSILVRCGVRNNISLEDWLLALHCPSNMSEASAAMAVAHRLAALEVCFQVMSLQHKEEVPDSAIPLQPKQVANLIAGLPFPLTEDQQSAIISICEDLIVDIPSRRLISGDVGTGKTACFAVAAAAAYLAATGSEASVPQSSQGVNAMHRELKAQYDTGGKGAATTALADAKDKLAFAEIDQGFNDATIEHSEGLIEDSADNLGAGGGMIILGGMNAGHPIIHDKKEGPMDQKSLDKNFVEKVKNNKSD